MRDLDDSNITGLGVEIFVSTHVKETLNCTSLCDSLFSCHSDNNKEMHLCLDTSMTACMAGEGQEKQVMRCLKEVNLQYTRTLFYIF